MSVQKSTENRIRIGIFASGNGSNALRMLEYFKDHARIEVAKIYCNKVGAGVIQKGIDNGVDVQIFSRKSLTNNTLTNQLLRDEIDVVVLAGFLWKIPSSMIQAYPDKIINIHPALLPLYGGKGMFGSHVHEAVISNGDKTSGITIHLVNEEYDRGRHLFQTTIEISANENADTLAAKIHGLEHAHFPRVVEDYVNTRLI
ncbi:MAG: phosphoribosylglycinamide formyltransferase-1 [Bacteroidia bacterium]|jgi:phosphoribosylglycinamide formyltransferase-1